jgi:hypothetical protein
VTGSVFDQIIGGKTNKQIGVVSRYSKGDRSIGLSTFEHLPDFGVRRLSRIPDRHKLFAA